MNFLRETFTLRVLSLVTALAIFNLSCTKENHLTESSLAEKSSCDGIIDFSGIVDLPAAIENMMYLTETVQRIKQFDDFGDLYQDFYGGSETVIQRIEVYETESEKYRNLGFSKYLLDVANRGGISEAMKDELLRFRSEVSTFVDSRHPRLSEFVSFLDTYKKSIGGGITIGGPTGTIEGGGKSGKGLCPEEVVSMEGIIDAVQGYAQYFYKKYYTGANLSARGCNFWEGLLCGALAVGVVILSAKLLGNAVSSADIPPEITYTDALGNTHTLTNPSLQEIADAQRAAAGIGGFLGLIPGIGLYTWCCSWFDDGNEICEKPTGHRYKILECSEYEFTIYGPSEYGETEWKNRNTNPEEAVTPTPSLRFTIPTVGNASLIDATIRCGAFNEYPYRRGIRLAGAEDSFELQWRTKPPSLLVLDQQGTPEGDIITLNGYITVSVNTPYNGQYNYSWSINAPYVISGSTTSSAATIVLTEPGTAVTTVTVENVCTGETQTITATTIVQTE